MAGSAAREAVPEGVAGTEGVQEPLWLVRAVLVLVLVGMAGYFARQVWLVAHS